MDRYRKKSVNNNCHCTVFLVLWFGVFRLSKPCVSCEECCDGEGNACESMPDLSLPAAVFQTPSGNFNYGT